MRVVLDATVLSNFALVGNSDLLPRAWSGELTTTEEAWIELQEERSVADGVSGKGRY